MTRTGDVAILAVDWSGARSTVHHKLWWAEARGERLVGLEPAEDYDVLGALLHRLPHTPDEEHLLEGEIWRPAM